MIDAVRVFLDANVLFSAASAGSVTDKLIHRLCAIATPVTSDLAIDEARRNLQRKRPAWLPHFEEWLVQIEHVEDVHFRLTIPLLRKISP